MLNQESHLSVQDIQMELQNALHVVHGLTLLHGVLVGRPAQAMLKLLSLLNDPEPEAIEVAEAYSTVFRELVAAIFEDGTPALSDAWQAYLVARLIEDSNLWSTRIEREGIGSISPALRKQAERDLRALQHLFHLPAEALLRLTLEAVTPVLPALADAWVPWRDLVVAASEEDYTTRQALAMKIASTADWSTLVAPLEQYWAHHGTGPLSRYYVFRWQGPEDGLLGIAHPDPIQLANLIGYEREQHRLSVNIEHFLAGRPAHDALLYGPPGTGKSSTVKALVNAYANQGLCLVEIHKDAVVDLPKIVAQLRGRAPYYLLFIDDLSFEEHETEYKVLKMLLEGTAEARPANILIYATTNRMNLIRENFADRGKPTEDVNWRDTMDEKQSLAHRFGMRVTFATPSQERYLSIAVGLAHQRGIHLPDETIRERALLWEHQRTGRSGRLARQFVDDLEAESRNEAGQKG